MLVSGAVEQQVQSTLTNEEQPWSSLTSGWLASYWLWSELLTPPLAPPFPHPLLPLFTPVDELRAECPEGFLQRQLGEGGSHLQRNRHEKKNKATRPDQRLDSLLHCQQVLFVSLLRS